MTNAAVLPVPFFARARMSRFARAFGIASSWIGEGRSNPASNIPMSNSRRRYISSQSVPLVAVTSSVCGLSSFGGARKPAFQSCFPVSVLSVKKNALIRGIQIHHVIKTQDLRGRGRGTCDL